MINMNTCTAVHIAATCWKQHFASGEIYESQCPEGDSAQRRRDQIRWRTAGVLVYLSPRESYIVIVMNVIRNRHSKTHVPRVFASTLPSFVSAAAVEAREINDRACERAGELSQPTKYFVVLVRKLDDASQLTALLTHLQPHPKRHVPTHCCLLATLVVLQVKSPVTWLDQYSQAHARKRAHLHQHRHQRQHRPHHLLARTESPSVSLPDKAAE